jgi:hypothetical protein
LAGRHGQVHLTLDTDVVPLADYNAATDGEEIARAGAEWVIVAGHRRHAAAARAKLDAVPAVLRPDLADPRSPSK